MTQSDNEIRAQRCDDALTRYGKGSLSENLTDFLTDAMHWCDTSLLDFHASFAQACRHYVHELNGEQRDERRMSPSSTVEPPEIDVHALLAERRQVAVVWSIEDVLGIRPDLKPEQAWDVLTACRDQHDCEWGFTWTFLKDIADDLFPPSAEPTASKKEARHE